MIEVALMIEGQDGLTWDSWQRIARIAEDGGFAGLYRSDHFTNPNAPEKSSLECWVALAWLASHTSRIEFGPLVSPMSFRDPRMLARQAAAVDDLSGGRLQLGLGAGWQEREHTMFGYDLLERGPRFARYREGVEVVTRLLRSAEPVSFSGSYYQLREAVLLPRPKRSGGPRIVIGGNGPQRTLGMAAQYADEWNCVYQPPARFKELSTRLDELLAARGRNPGDVRRTMMTGVFLARDKAELERRLGGRTKEALRERGAMVGSPDEIREQLAEVESVGLRRVMLQWLQIDDFEGMEALGRGVFR
jgi:F420-dependent oxidoreductase-like protein